MISQSALKPVYYHACRDEVGALIVKTGYIKAPRKETSKLAYASHDHLLPMRGMIYLASDLDLVADRFGSVPARVIEKNPGELNRRWYLFVIPSRLIDSSNALIDEDYAGVLPLAQKVAAGTVSSADLASRGKMAHDLVMGLLSPGAAKARPFMDKAAEHLKELRKKEKKEFVGQPVFWSAEKQVVKKIGQELADELAKSGANIAVPWKQNFQQAWRIPINTPVADIFTVGEQIV